MTTVYPEAGRDRDAWILARRGARNRVDPRRASAFLVENELSEQREIVSVATIFLTNRECPWRCVMCDLWKNTLAETVPIGAIPQQIDFALSQLPPAKQIKLYNSGSFFDRAAIPTEDHPAIVERLSGFERVIVECHPDLINHRVLRFRDRLNSSLEVAMGLETAHAATLERLNKKMGLECFAAAADFLRANGVSLRVFILVKPPFQDEEDAATWSKRSIDFAFDCGATVVSVIPTRFGSGALEALASEGHFSPPTLGSVEATLEYGIGLKRERVFADVWDLEKFSRCSACLPSRFERLSRMNLRQAIEPRIYCRDCDKVI